MRQAGCRMIYAPQVLVRHQWPHGRLTRSLFANASSGRVGLRLTTQISPFLFSSLAYTWSKNPSPRNWQHFGISARVVRWKLCAPSAKLAHTRASSGRTGSSNAAFPEYYLKILYCRRKWKPSHGDSCSLSADWLENSFETCGWGEIT
jgi:hypothetical protein